MTQQLEPTGQQPMETSAQPGQTGTRQGQMNAQPGQMGSQQATQMGSQPGEMGGQQGQTMTQQGQMPGQSGGTLPQQYRTALHNVAQAIQVCGWCADQCIQSADPHMIECIRLCEDVVELGETVLATVPRSSRSTGQVLQAFQQAAQACAQECGQHRDAHCQECANVLPKAISATQQLSNAGQQPAGAPQQQGPMGASQQTW